MPQNKSSRRWSGVFRRGDTLTLDGEADKVKASPWTLEVSIDNEPLKPIELDEERYQDIFKDIHDRPTTLNVLRLKPEMLIGLGRSGRRETITALARQKARIALSKRHTVGGTDRREARRAKPSKPVEDGDYNLAIATILSLALRYRERNEPDVDSGLCDRDTVPELLALSPPETMEAFRAFLEYGFLQFNDIPYLVHVAARNVAHDDEGGTDEPISVLKNVSDLVSGILQETQKPVQVGEEEGEESVKLFEPCLRRWSNDIDRGIQIGLVLAGIRKYFNNLKEAKEKRYAVAFGLVDVLLAGLTGIPAGGVAFSVTQSLVTQWKERKLEKRLKQVDGPFDIILDRYYQDVDFPLHKNVSNEGEDSIDVMMFTRWVNLVMRYNRLAQI